MHLRARISLMAALAIIGEFVASDAHAQVPTYRRSATDTLRYHDVTLGTVTATSPAGAMSVNSKHDAIVAMVMAPGQSARAWYESLQIEQATAQGTSKPVTAGVLRQPYVMTIDARGRINVTKTPTFPAEIKQVTNLDHQFDDFLMRLPTKPFAPKLEWTDTANVRTSQPTGQYSNLTAIAHYRVMSDTTVNAERGVVVSMVQELTLEAGGPLDGQPVKAASQLAGRDSGSVVFSVTNGRMLAREHKGSLKGTLTYTSTAGAGPPVTMPQQYQYQNVLTLQKL